LYLRGPNGSTTTKEVKGKQKMRNPRPPRNVLALICAGALLASPVASRAADTGSSNEWQYGATIYRHIPWDFESSSRMDNINFSGPLLAATFRF